MALGRRGFLRAIGLSGLGVPASIRGLEPMTAGIRPIGDDGHEWTNFVRGNKTPLAPGMCFSDEPMVAITASSASGSRTASI